MNGISAGAEEWSSRLVRMVSMEQTDAGRQSWGSVGLTCLPWGSIDF